MTAAPSLTCRECRPTLHRHRLAPNQHQGMIEPDRESAVSFQEDVPAQPTKQAGTEGLEMVTRPLVSVVDDDESLRESLPDLLQEFGFSVRTFASAEEFLASESIDQTRCLLLDITMPGMSGPALQEELWYLWHLLVRVYRPSP